MPEVNGCPLPDDLLYDVENQLWYRERPDGLVDRHDRRGGGDGRRADRGDHAEARRAARRRGAILRRHRIRQVRGPGEGVVRRRDR